MPNRLRSVGFSLWTFAVATVVGLGEGAVDFRFSPPKWQTAICLPDDGQKTLVDRSGELLYHYNQGGREFGTRIGVEVVPGAVWQRQELHSARVPIVLTFRLADGLEIVEEAWAVTALKGEPVPRSEEVLRRVDQGTVNRDWANPPTGTDPALRHIALHNGGSIRYTLTVPVGAARRIALALCEGFWNQPGQRVQELEIEGAAVKTVDTVADLGRNIPAAFWFDGRDVNGDGRIEITVEAAAAAGDQNTILNGLWVFPADQSPDSEALLAGRLDASGRVGRKTARSEGPPRNDVILVRVTNTGGAARTLQPRLIVDSTLDVVLDPVAEQVVVNDHETVTASLKVVGPIETEASRHAVRLESLALLAGESATFFLRYSGGGRIVAEPRTLQQALACRAEAVRYWEGAGLPYGRVEVPDPGIQALLDSSIRNIWQAREIKRGLPAFQVGPTCYRGLWIVDGAFLLEAATLLGAGAEARNGVAYELTYQQEDGSIRVMDNFSKENGIVLWTCVRHARLTQDRVWLESVWPRLERVAEHIRTLRRQTLGNDSPLDDGLVPAGFPDGGIGGVMDEYTNPYWNLVGMRAFVQGARWLGKEATADVWQVEYDDFMSAYRRAAARDQKTDPEGNLYVPTRMDGADLPQRGQWAFCQAVYPGQIFGREDPLVGGTLAMLEATEREGMVYGTGWDASGLWNYFASFYGHAWLWQGRGSKAAEVLYAFAQHAAPTLVWREEQSLRGEPFKKVGDMPHNWASAEFIRLVVHLLALDRGDELHLLEGFPLAWAGPGMTTRLHGVATPFGLLHLDVTMDERGETLELALEPLHANCRAVVVHLPDGTTREWSPTLGGVLRLAIGGQPGASAGVRSVDP